MKREPEAGNSIRKRKLTPTEAGFIGALAVLTPAAVMGAIELSDSDNRQEVVTERHKANTSNNLTIELPTETGDIRIDDFNNAQNIADPTNPNKLERELSQAKAREAQDFQP